MKQSDALAYIRQLCCLGLAKEIMLSEFLRAVQMVIPSGSNVFLGVDGQFTPTYTVIENYSAEILATTQEIVPIFFNYQTRLRFVNSFSQDPISTDFRLFAENFEKTDFYNLIWRKLDQHHFAAGSLFRNGQIFGMTVLFRPITSKPFSKDEQVLFKYVLPYLTHALSVQCEEEIPYSESGQSGMMIMDSQGSLLFQSEAARQLLALTHDPLIRLNYPATETSVLPQLGQLCRNLNAIFQGKVAAPPSWAFTNGHGRFVFRAYWLDSENKSHAGLIGMTVEHQEPQTLRILRALQNLPLSQTQKEVAILLAQGASNTKIGQQLHIKPTTVKDHVSKIFTKLDIQHREELLPKLLAMGSLLQVSDRFGKIRLLE